MSDGRPAINKSDTRGVAPGPATGVVKSYNAKRAPFGGFITHDGTGVDIFVHKSVVEEAKLAKIDPGQQVSFEVVEDGFGGIKSSRLALK